MVYGVDCLGSDDRKDKNNYLKTKPFGVSKTLGLKEIRSEKHCKKLQLQENPCKNLKPAVPRFSVKTEQSVNDECGSKSSVNNAAGQVKNDAGDIYDSAGSIQIDKIHNDICGSASSQEVFNIGHSTTVAPEQVGAADMSSII